MSALRLLLLLLALSVLGAAALVLWLHARDTAQMRRVRSAMVATHDPAPLRPGHDLGPPRPGAALFRRRHRAWHAPAPRGAAGDEGGLRPQRHRDAHGRAADPRAAPAGLRPAGRHRPRPDADFRLGRLPRGAARRELDQVLAPRPRPACPHWRLGGPRQRRGHPRHDGGAPGPRSPPAASRRGLAPTGPDSAEIRFAGLDIAPMQITFDAAGYPTEVQALRWTDANPAKTWRLQPFGGRMLEMGQVEGFLIPPTPGARQHVRHAGLRPLLPRQGAPARVLTPAGRSTGRPGAIGRRLKKSV